MWSNKNLGHTQIISFADETHLTHQKITKVTQLVQVIRPIFNPVVYYPPINFVIIYAAKNSQVAVKTSLSLVLWTTQTSPTLNYLSHYFVLQRITTSKYSFRNKQHWTTIYSLLWQYNVDKYSESHSEFRLSGFLWFDPVSHDTQRKSDPFNLYKWTDPTQFQHWCLLAHKRMSIYNLWRYVHNFWSFSKFCFWHRFAYFVTDIHLLVIIHMYTNINLLMKRLLSNSFSIVSSIPGLHNNNFSQHTSLYGKIKIFKCCIYLSKVGTFKGLFKFSTFVYALIHISVFLVLHLAMYITTFSIS